MEHKKPTVAVAICALNEGQNIADLLETILKQKEETYTLNNILIISDGSTDDTVKKIKQFNDPRIILKDYKERRGKSFRLNEIYATVTSDFIVQPDADVMLAHEYVIQSLVQPMIDNPKVGMTGGNPVPAKPETFLEKAVEVTYKAYISMRESIRNGNNIYTATGRLIALRKEVYHTIKVPKETISNDHFVYFWTLKMNYTFAYADKALVYFRLPQTLHDHVNQETRFSSAEHFMRKYFSLEVVDREYEIPRGLFYKSILKQVIKYPHLCAYIFVINSYCKLRAFLTWSKIDALWDVVYTTKHVRNHSA